MSNETGVPYPLPFIPPEIYETGELGLNALPRRKAVSKLSCTVKAMIKSDTRADAAASPARQRRDAGHSTRKGLTPPRQPCIKKPREQNRAATFQGRGRVSAISN